MMRSDEFRKLDSCDGRGVVLDPPQPPPPPVVAVVTAVVAAEEATLVAVCNFF